MIGTTLTIITLAYFINNCIAGAYCKILGHFDRQSFELMGKKIQIR